ncbi:hypothetical protein [Salinisphaera sp. Q1T1-3]|uniref:hypothetical protein n=1 Tax=Salinisphaera sp. Q1T1-3 TaxID=2321229 RepID=UPI0011C49B63|nr:hypothetical protein [Salinisphaera sp. Q1T1-3]
MRQDPAILIRSHNAKEPFFWFGKKHTNKYNPVRLKVLAMKPEYVMADHKQRVHTQPIAWGAIHRVYPNAIEIEGGKESAPTEWVVAVAVFLGFVSAGLLIVTVMFLLAGAFLIIPMGLPVLLFALSATWMMIRLAIWPAVECPVMFNRRDRTVTVRHFVRRGFLNVRQLKPKSYLRTYSWDRQVQARTYVARGGTAVSYIVQRDLNIVMGEADDPTKFKDYHRVGEITDIDAEPLLELWEYIRRYMEEDGPTVSVGCVPDFDAPPSPFPQDVLDAAGGAPLGIDEIEALLNAQGQELSDELRESWAASLKRRAEAETIQ